MPPCKVLSEADLQRTNQKKKRQQHPNETKDEIRKTNKNRGNPYRTRKGNFVPGIQPPVQAKTCGACTKPGCFLPLRFKLEVFEQYWHKMDTYEKKASFLMKCVEIHIPKTRSNPQHRSRIENVYTYSVLHQGLKQEMCKKGFLDMLQIKEKSLRTVITKMKAGEMCAHDGRGQHAKPKIPAVTRNAVIAFIQQYPTRETHYRRMAGNPQRRYLDSSLNLSILYNDYITFCRANNGQNHEVDESYFRQVFYTFKLSFGNPKQDTCDQCDKLLIAIQSDPLVATQRDLHHAEAEATYEAYRSDKQRSKLEASYVTITVDLQQVIFTPRLRNNSAFYLRKLTNYNLGIHNAGDDSSLMNLWSETTGKRGSNEISSIVWKYLTSKYPTLGPGEERELVVWSDRCVGQNNNFIMLTMLTCLVRLGLFTTVNHKLFVTGHSYNDCDRDFGNIESKLKVCPLIVPSDIEVAILNARFENPFSCNWVPSAVIKDFMELSTLYKRPRTLKVTEELWFCYESKSPQQILTRQNHNAGGVWERHHLVLKSGRAIQIGNFNFGNLNRAYNEDLLLTEEKVKDLEKLLQFLEPEAASFYEYLILESQDVF